MPEAGDKPMHGPLTHLPQQPFASFMGQPTEPGIWEERWWVGGYDLGARCAAMAERIRDVLLDRHVRPDRVGLEHHADVAQARRHLDAVERRRHQSPADADAPGGGMLEARDAA